MSAFPLNLPHAASSKVSVCISGHTTRKKARASVRKSGGGGGGENEKEKESEREKERERKRERKRERERVSAQEIPRDE